MRAYIPGPPETPQDSLVMEIADLRGHVAESWGIADEC